MKIPSKLRIFGEIWKIKIAPKTKDNDDISSFSFRKKQIVVSETHKETGFFHEVLEAIMLNNYCRFYGQEGGMEYMFIMKHTDFCKVAKQLADTLKDNKII